MLGECLLLHRAVRSRLAWLEVGTITHVYVIRVLVTTSRKQFRKILQQFLRTILLKAMGWVVLVPTKIAAVGYV
jgi:hypothetical protein